MIPCRMRKTALGAEKEEGNMKWIHLSDLHLGKRLREVSLMEDQTYILGQIMRKAT